MLTHRLPERLAWLGCWQNLPCYAAGGAALAGWSVTASALVAASAVSRMLVPLPAPEGVPGPFPVGVVDFEATVDGVRAMGRMLYPAAGPSLGVARYMSLPAAGLTRRFIADAAPAALRPYLPAWALDHWNAVTIRAARAAAPAGSAPLPVVVFSHGLTAARETSQTLALTLAAAGALVVLVEHTDRSSSLARYLDGASVPFDRETYALGSAPPTEAYKDARRAQAAVRADELRRHLALLGALDRGGDDAAALALAFDGVAPGAARALVGALAGRLALRSVALGGHSFGGASVLTLLAALSERPLPAGVALAAGFTLDPAVDWVPTALRERIGYGEFGNYGLAQKPAAIEAGAPPHLPHPLLTVWSEEWQQYGWYQQWSANLTARAAPLSHALVVKGCGHQGLCDVAIMLPHRLNLLLRNSLGTPSDDLTHATNSVVLGFLRNARVIDGDITELEALASTSAHQRAPSSS